MRIRISVRKDEEEALFKHLFITNFLFLLVFFFLPFNNSTPTCDLCEELNFRVNVAVCLGLFFIFFSWNLFFFFSPA